MTATALVNTCRNGRESLTHPELLEKFLRKHQVSGVTACTDAEVAAVRDLGRQLRWVWDAADGLAAAEAVNDVLSASDALPRLVQHDGWALHLHYTDPTAPLAARLGAEFAMGLADLLRRGDADRLRRCEAVDCEAVVTDLSRNRSRRYCDTGNCGNRQHAAAYRARKAARVSGCGPG